MEQHPVPQNVTTFQFRLIGDMTLKQFGYLALGAIIGYVCYKLPLPVFFTLPLGVGVFLFGFGLAFVPIEERPMDVWVLSFIKSIYSPTLYVWQREKPVAEQSSAPPPVTTQVPVRLVQVQNRPQTLGSPVSQPPLGRARIVSSTHHYQTGGGLMAWLSSLFSSSKPKTSPPPAVISSPPAPVFQTPQAPHPQGGNIFSNLQTPSIVGKRPEKTAPPDNKQTEEESAQRAIQQEQSRLAEEKSKEYEQKILSLQKELENRTASDTRILELQKQLTDVLSERHKMEQEMVALRTKLERANASIQPLRPSSVAQPQTPSAPTVTVITAETAVKAGLPRLTTFPNVVTGIIRDHENNLLPGVLITVRDKDGVPLRALKTNRLGQFAASTPLPNNTYFIEVEDPRNRYVFDRVQIELGGGIVPAIEIVAKSQKQLSREKLAKEIFSNQDVTG